MFAVWNGKTLEVIECENKTDVIFAAAKKACNNAHLEMMPMSYIKASRMMTALHHEGISVLCDEDGMNKKLPVTLSLDNFVLLGPIIFLASDSNYEFTAMSDSQINTIKRLLRKHVTHSESKLTINMLDRVIAELDKACDAKGITKDEFIENLVIKELGLK